MVEWLRSNSAQLTRRAPHRSRCRREARLVTDQTYRSSAPRNPDPRAPLAAGSRTAPHHGPAVQRSRIGGAFQPKAFHGSARSRSAVHGAGGPPGNRFGGDQCPHRRGGGTSHPVAGGRSWQTHIDWQRRQVYVEATEIAGRTKWSSVPDGASFALARGVREVLLGAVPVGVTLTKRAKAPSTTSACNAPTISPPTPS